MVTPRLFSFVVHSFQAASQWSSVSKYDHWSPVVKKPSGWSDDYLTLSGVFQVHRGDLLAVSEMTLFAGGYSVDLLVTKSYMCLIASMKAGRVTW